MCFFSTKLAYMHFSSHKIPSHIESKHEARISKINVKQNPEFKKGGMHFTFTFSAYFDIVSEQLCQSEKTQTTTTKINSRIKGKITFKTHFLSGL